MTRPRGFAAWQPRTKSKLLVQAVNEVLYEYREQLPLTIRQIFYRLVGTDFIGKTERDYGNLCELINRARRAHLIDMGSFRDDGFRQTRIDCFGSLSDAVSVYRTHAESITMDRQQGQAQRLMVWCEAGGMKPMLERVCTPYGVTVSTSSGFDSTTTKHQTGKAFAELESIEVLHIGDHDPSGVCVFGSLDEDVRAFAEHYGGQVEFTRLAVTSEQQQQYDLPTAPPKQTDKRGNFKGQTVQAEALPPDVLLSIVEQAIRQRFDMAVYGDVMRAARELQAEILQALEAVA